METVKKRLKKSKELGFKFFFKKMLIIVGWMMTFLHSFMQTDPPGGDNIPIDIHAYIHGDPYHEVGVVRSQLTVILNPSKTGKSGQCQKE